MADDCPIEAHTLLLRAVFDTEVSVLTGELSSTAFEPPKVEMDSTAFSPKGEHDAGQLSTEHEDRPGGAVEYLHTCGLDGVEGIWAVSVGECSEVDLKVIPDGHLSDRSDWHVSVDFRADLSDGSWNLNKRGKRKARKLRDYAVKRPQQA